MDFVTLHEFRTQPGKVWKKLAKARELVVTRNGKPFALLTETSPTRLEDYLRALRRAGKPKAGMRLAIDTNVPVQGRASRTLSV